MRRNEPGNDLGGKAFRAEGTARTYARKRGWAIREREKEDEGSLIRLLEGKAATDGNGEESRNQIPEGLVAQGKEFGSYWSVCKQCSDRRFTLLFPIPTYHAHICSHT